MASSAGTATAAQRRTGTTMVLAVAGRTRPLRTAGPWVHARVCAAAALASAVAHLWMGWEHRAMVWESALMLAMAVACLPCAVRLWRRVHARAAHMLMGMSLGMAVFHAALLLGAFPGGQHVHGAAQPVARIAGEAAVAESATMGMLAIIVLEFTAAMAAATLLRRLHAGLTTRLNTVLPQRLER